MRGGERAFWVLVYPGHDGYPSFHRLVILLV
jgi:hypothetical protein